MSDTSDRPGVPEFTTADLKDKTDAELEQLQQALGAERAKYRALQLVVQGELDRRHEEYEATRQARAAEQRGDAPPTQQVFG